VRQRDIDRDPGDRQGRGGLAARRGTAGRPLARLDLSCHDPGLPDPADKFAASFGMRQAAAPALQAALAAAGGDQEHGRRGPGRRLVVARGRC
jgi:hypothetical protein